MGNTLPYHRPARSRRDTVKEINILLGWTGNAQGSARYLHRPTIELSQHTGKLQNLLIGCQAAGNRPTVLAHVATILVGRESYRAGAHPPAEKILHLLDFGGSRGSL
jgi:hypothetical protein